MMASTTAIAFRTSVAVVGWAIAGGTGRRASTPRAIRMERTPSTSQATMTSVWLKARAIRSGRAASSTDAITHITPKSTMVRKTAWRAALASWSME